MNLLDIFRGKVSTLPEGEYMSGLLAVQSHIETAIRHLERGQTQGDESAFTDAIYRCNQAFEGSIKEAYRVLASKNPRLTTPATIEQFLASTNVLRQRVLSQFTNYRQSWRNPSTHDYTLDFDEDEALLAIVYVLTFSIVLADQIAEKVAFVKAESESDGAAVSRLLDGTLLHQVAEATRLFANTYRREEALDENYDASRLVGALGGFLSRSISKANTSLNEIFSKENVQYQPDIVVGDENSKVIVEIKRRDKSLGRLSRFHRPIGDILDLEGVSGLILCFYVSNKAKYVLTEFADKHWILVHPEEGVTL